MPGRYAYPGGHTQPIPCQFARSNESWFIDSITEVGDTSSDGFRPVAAALGFSPP